MIGPRNPRLVSGAVRAAIIWGWMGLKNVIFCSLYDWVNLRTALGRDIAFLVYDVMYIVVSPLLFAVVMWFLFQGTGKRTRRKIFLFSVLFDLAVVYFQGALLLHRFIRCLYSPFESQISLNIIGVTLATVAALAVLASIVGLIKVRETPVLMRMLAIPGIAGYLTFFMGYHKWPWNVDPEEGIVVPSLAIMEDLILAIIIAAVVWVIEERMVSKIITRLRGDSDGARA